MDDFPRKQVPGVTDIQQDHDRTGSLSCGLVTSPQENTARKNDGHFNPWASMTARAAVKEGWRIVRLREHVSPGVL